jgi:hypothetical protein
MKNVTRFTLVAALSTAMALLGSAVAQAAGPGHYVISSRGGAAYTFLTSNNLFSGFVDDQIAVVSTSGSGAAHLPFQVRVYGQLKSTLYVSSNGNVQFAAPGNTEYNNDCLPSSLLSGKVIAPFWDDLTEDTSISGQGVFTRVSGSAPHRKFTISWQGVRFADQDPVQAELIFTEGSQTLSMVYDKPEGESATIGTQAGSKSFTQYACNTGSTTTVVAGLRLDFLHVN